MERTGPGEPEAEQTRDDTDLGWGDRYDDAADRERDADRRLLEERPPHHDRP